MDTKLSQGYLKFYTLDSHGCFVGLFVIPAKAGIQGELNENVKDKFSEFIV